VTPVADRYVVPGWFTRNVFNRAVAGLTRLGISVWGSRVLEVRGRKSGEPRRTPVNMLTLDAATYLVAPRGHTQWVRNLRVAGEGELLLGRRRQHFVASEVPDAEKEPILRAYLERWKWEVGQFFGGVGADSSAEELQRIAPDHPIFRVQLLESSSTSTRTPASATEDGATSESPSLDARNGAR
jgi:deazaflavin-dependent oxidoreductase (nitroreductase family)